jgi:intracellular sulfur oxidation DsrE/DsrF family protein
MGNAGATERQGLVLQVNDNDPKVWHRVLNLAHYAQKNAEHPLDVTVVVFGPGIHMLSKLSRVANQLYTTTRDGVMFLACGKTMKRLKIKDNDLYPSDHVKRVDGGVIEIMRLQHAGWKYIKP